ncbi:MAG: oligopeptide transporter, OPT family [Elusimicrobia bacterium]|nr:oligopeptide transporter, OPT family [Elusimicrobiota bacterium]
MENSKHYELTLRAFLLGILLSSVMAAANVYLGLKAGMTVSASIPAAVMAMGVLRLFPRRGSIFESNLVQTAASAGESLAAGIIFTMPALVIAGIWKTFDFWITSLIALTGGVLGTLFMIPMRKVFVVENKELAYPEGLACAEVLRAGEGENASGAALVFGSLVVGGLFKFAGSFLGFFKSSLEAAVLLGQRVFFIGCDVSPALIAVGYIVKLHIAILIFMGGALAWLVGIPLLGKASGDPVESAWHLWSTQIRYMGVGAMAVGGLASIYRVRAGLAAAFQEIKKQFSGGSAAGLEERERDMRGSTILALSALCILMIIGIYHHVTQDWPVTLTAAASMVVLSFFMTAVASYIVGLVGNSNSPVSGMTITAVLVTGGLLYILGFSGANGILATLGVAGIVCCVACTSGDVCNDLKTGYLIGASPRRQQWMQVAGVLAGAFVLAPVLIAMHEGSLRMGGTGIGGRDYPAPQANLFANLTRGFFGGGSLPWNMIAMGCGVGVLILILDAVLGRQGSRFRMHLMPVAVGIYLPFGLSVPILIGGLLSQWVGYRSWGAEKESNHKRGVLVSSGMIAGESLVGVALAILAYFGIGGLGIAARMGLSSGGVELLSAGALAAACLLFYRWSFPKK